MKIYAGKLTRPLTMSHYMEDTLVVVPNGAEVSVREIRDGSYDLNYTPSAENFGAVYWAIVRSDVVEIGEVIQTFNEGKNPMPDWKPDNSQHQPIHALTEHKHYDSIVALLDGEWMDGTLPSDDWISYPSDSLVDWWAMRELTRDDYEGDVEPGWYAVHVNDAGIRTIYGPATEEQLRALFKSIEEGWENE